MKNVLITGLKNIVLVILIFLISAGVCFSFSSPFAVGIPGFPDVTGTQEDSLQNRMTNRRLIWADEFNGPALDLSTWSFQLGQFNDCIHYSTDRSANTKITDGKLQLIALQESYMGYDYTASVIKTKHTVSWRYGRIEARIKLPVSNGFVPAFWLMPEDERYGWWPMSGEIDIMEHPTNEVNKIYGTVHTDAYSYFTGSEPRGGTIVIDDAGSAFHLYAIEWSLEKIDFFVDDQKYFTFNNEHQGFQTWPFDQPFYIILNMAVGGGWVGNPTASTIFPAIMEVDYVRVYQTTEDISVSGPDFVMPQETGLHYTAPFIDGASYEWSVPNTAQIISGQNTPQIEVSWGQFTGNVELLITTDEETRLMKYPVEMSHNLLKNGGFEKGSKYWRALSGPPAVAGFSLSADVVHTGSHSTMVNIKNPGNNAWDIQLSQTDITLKAGQRYDISFRAKAEANMSITAAIINASSFNLYAGNPFQITTSWELYSFDFVAPANATASFNIDLGAHSGIIYFDDLQMKTPPPDTNNQVKNADFSSGDSEWHLTTLLPAMANGRIVDGEYAVTITNSGENPWDVHVGQTGLNVEKGKEYTVSFDAYADTPTEVFPLVGKNAEPWTVYGDSGQIMLSTNRKTYTFRFIMNEPTDTIARMGFDIGQSAGTIYFDNIFLSKGQWTTNVSEQTANPEKPFRLMQNSPNPFNMNTLVEFELFEPGLVSGKIFDMRGMLIHTLIDENLSAGMHQLQWDGRDFPSGIYFFILSGNGMS